MAEAVELRDAGITAPILVLSYTPVYAVRQAIRHHIAVALYDQDMARAYDRAARELGGKLRVHVKVDTGMGRLGVPSADSMVFFRHVTTMRHLEIEGIYTHFSAADSDPDYTAEQVREFRSVLKPLRASGFEFKYRHAANSAGTLASKDNHFNMARVGIALYGISPFADKPLPAKFRPVMTWKTVVAQVRKLPPNHPVGYGNTYRTQGEERIAILPIGYADGLRRSPKSWGEVLIHGQRAPLVGRVSMEKVAVNVSHIQAVSIGDEVVLLGTQGDDAITAEEVARRWDTIPYEVVTSILARVPRR
jgi:alanine racemase